jgi:hypothetical protein
MEKQWEDSDSKQWKNNGNIQTVKQIPVLVCTIVAITDHF